MPETETKLASSEKNLSAPPLFGDDSVTGGANMKVGELPGQSVVLEVQSLGRDVWKIFKENPELAGIIFIEASAYVGMVSSTQFLKIMSRPFGREIFEGRPLSLLLKELENEPLMLDYETGIQSAMEACLERERRHIYEPFLAVNREKGLIKVCTVQVLMHASAKAANFRNQQMQQILGSVTDGLLLVDRDFRIGGEYSHALEQILERSDIPGKLFNEVLSPILEPRLRSQAAEYLEVLFDKKLIDRLIKSINPIQEVMVSIHRPEMPDALTKYLTFNFERIRSQGEIRQVLVRIEDITRRVNLARELQQRESDAENRMKLMLEIVSVEPVALKAFLSSYDREVSRALAEIRAPGPDNRLKPFLESLSRSIHGLKGDASLLQLEIYKDRLHAFEDRMEEFRKPGEPAAIFHSLDAALETLLLPLREAQSILDSFNKWHDSPARVDSPGSGEKRPLPLIPQIMDMVEKTSARLGKKAHLHSMMDEELLPTAYLETIKDVLIQLVRNSLAHGLESPEQRQNAGKPPEGTLQIVLEKTPENLEIIFQDDGAGLDLEKISVRARDLDLLVPGESILSNLIFAPGFSTAEQVTEDAGRGVGLDLIRNRITALGGKIEVHSEQGVYCAFRIFLPNPDQEKS